ncbi:hypothetical protein KSF_051540 [Reticulibacter mediterranei]|uniref:Uncharacterized protein n=1 Tax=Reticulibacter mediterranei TaxID=2778369 RepID=A0A8J3ITN4_9CHLR|nr:hypothetical protein [Reticulibacter mediterranei]GHO95106.1 hypothetical protein KSF_051540 [Reticulibacter mediterranei]
MQRLPKPGIITATRQLARSVHMTNNTSYVPLMDVISVSKNGGDRSHLTSPYYGAVVRESLYSYGASFYW